MSLKHKRILITAGPTWVPVDTVRIISNIATGQTGILLAKRLHRLGAKVSLILGPVETANLGKKIKVIRFKFFNELKKILFDELKNKDYDILIHSAAVSDYRPKIKYLSKIESGLKSLNLRLMPTEKIIDKIKKIKPSLYLVGFKFEPQKNTSFLLKRAVELLKRAKADLVVANTLDKNGDYRAYVINQDRVYGPISGKLNLVERLIKIIRNVPINKR
ncbi:MAG: phosphopantothenoylcysteine decarboxylase [Candidatus Omnitrophica bacterium]|nr:phosphopantothenoylcysteine decarboxylase [Candidatus Omnitrophota bacterium]